jgi:hypothetical protein
MSTPSGAVRTETRRRAEHRRATLAQVATRLAEVLPALAAADVEPLLAAARADRGIGLRELAAHLAAHPDALTSASSRCPAVVMRLAHVLHDAGHVDVVRPGCADCSTVTAVLKRLGPHGRICDACAARTTVGTCDRCGRTARIAARRRDGRICYSCYRIDPDAVRECAGCGRSGCRSPGATTTGRSATVAGSHRRESAPAAAGSDRPRLLTAPVGSARGVTGSTPGRAGHADVVVRSVSSADVPPTASPTCARVAATVDSRPAQPAGEPSVAGRRRPARGSAAPADREPVTPAAAVSGAGRSTPGGRSAQSATPATQRSSPHQASVHSVRTFSP